MNHDLLNTSLMNNLMAQCTNGMITWNRSTESSIDKAIKRLDSLINNQVNVIMKSQPFKSLESHWQGLNYLINHVDTKQNIKIKCLDVTKEELSQDQHVAHQFNRSELFKKIYDTQFNMPGGEPYSVLLADYQFNHYRVDIDLLDNLSQVAQTCFAPLIAAADPSLFGFKQWSELTYPHDIEQIFEGSEYHPWHHLRERTNSRYITLTLPRMSIKDQCWINSAYALTERMCHAFHQYGWCTAIRGFEGGGKVSNLPVCSNQYPTEVSISDTREAELSRLGLMPLCYYQNTDHAVFFGSDSLHKPKLYDNENATRNAQIAARLPYIMATSRFAHYLKVIARDKIGAFMQREEVEHWLNHWINQYVNGNANSKHDLKNKYPLAAAKIEVRDIPEKPGSYQATAWLKPWLQLEELTTSLRLVAEIPKRRR